MNIEDDPRDYDYVVCTLTRNLVRRTPDGPVYGPEQIEVELTSGTTPIGLNDETIESILAVGPRTRVTYIEPGKSVTLHFRDGEEQLITLDMLRGSERGQLSFLELRRR